MPFSANAARELPGIERRIGNANRSFRSFRVSQGWISRRSVATLGKLFVIYFYSEIQRSSIDSDAIQELIPSEESFACKSHDQVGFRNYFLFYFILLFRTYRLSDLKLQK
jgi:hypothetical protein